MDLNTFFWQYNDKKHIPCNRNENGKGKVNFSLTWSNSVIWMGYEIVRGSLDIHQNRKNYNPKQWIPHNFTANNFHHVSQTHTSSPFSFATNTQARANHSEESGSKPAILPSFYFFLSCFFTFSLFFFLLFSPGSQAGLYPKGRRGLGAVVWLGGLQQRENIFFYKESTTAQFSLCFCCVYCRGYTLFF